MNRRSSEEESESESLIGVPVVFLSLRPLLFLVSPVTFPPFDPRPPCPVSILAQLPIDLLLKRKKIYPIRPRGPLTIFYLNPFGG